MDAPAVLSAPEGLLEQLGLSKAGDRLNLVAYCKTTHEKPNESQQAKKALLEFRGKHIGRYVGWHSADTSADMLQLTVGGVSVDCLWYRSIVHRCFAETAAISLPTGAQQNTPRSV